MRKKAQALADWGRANFYWLLFCGFIAIFIFGYADLLDKDRPDGRPLAGNRWMEQGRLVGGMTDSVYLTQGFTCTDTVLSGVSFMVTTFGGEPKGELVACLQDDTGAVVAECRYALEEIEDGKEHSLFLDEPLWDAQGKHYTILLYCETDQSWEDAITFYIGKEIAPEEPAYLNGAPLEGPISYVWYGRRVHLGAWLAAAGALMFAVCVAVWAFCKRKNLPPQKVYLLLVAAFSLFYVIAYPLGTVPDELAHYTRACTIANGDLFPNELSQGRVREGQISAIGSTGDSLYESWTARGLRVGPEAELRSVGNTAMYTPVGYLPQALGIRLGLLFGNRRYCSAYLARLLNWAAAVAVMYFAIWRIPFGKNVIAAMAMTAICLQETVSSAVDGISFSLSFAMLAIVLYLCCTPDAKADWRTAALLIGCSFLLATTKTLYVPFCLLALFIPKRCFSGMGHRCGVLAGVLAAGPGVALAWTRYASGLIHITALRWVDASAQKAYILEDIGRYCGVMFRTMTEQSGWLFTGAFSGSLKAFDLRTPPLAIGLSLLSFILICAWQKGLPEGLRGGAALRLCMVVIAAAVLIFSMTGEYLQWTGVGAGSVAGLQGRYFLPLIPLLFFAFKPAHRTGQPAGEARAEDGCWMEFLMIVAVNTICFMTVLNATLV